MSRLRLLGLAGLLTMQAGVAAAADMPAPLPPPPAPFVDLNAGWYLRGDLGYNAGELLRADAAPGFTSPTDNRIDDGFMAGVGIGIKTKWARTDVTVDYSTPMKYTGTVASSGDVSAKISATTALVNGYLDLGTWYRVTPYIGVGGGAAYVSLSDFQSAASPPFSGGDRGRWNFAYAAMAGVGYAVAPNLMVDVGYRYLNWGDVPTASDAFGEMTFKNVYAHELRVGVRWSFDDITRY
jgi:opacity protein-like surface antigen